MQNHELTAAQLATLAAAISLNRHGTSIDRNVEGSRTTRRDYPRHRERSQRYEKENRIPRTASNRHRGGPANRFAGQIPVSGPIYQDAIAPISNRMKLGFALMLAMSFGSILFHVVRG